MMIRSWRMIRHNMFSFLTLNFPAGRKFVYDLLSFIRVSRFIIVLFFSFLTQKECGQKKKKRSHKIRALLVFSDYMVPCALIKICKLYKKKGVS